MFSLRSLIDDILLLVRNNNISESEDFSRAQIANWILSYKSFLVKQKRDKEKEQAEDDEDKSLYRTIGPLELIKQDSFDNSDLYTKRTKDELPELASEDPKDIIAVFDQDGCPIQFMNDKRRHFQYFRKYTFGEMTWAYHNNYIYVQGTVDEDELKYIFVTGVFLDTDADNEDDIVIPGWMVPTIKQLIIQNELNLMLRLPSDDQNNSTVDEIKPQSPELRTPRP